MEFAIGSAIGSSGASAGAARRWGWSSSASFDRGCQRGHRRSGRFDGRNLLLPVSLLGDAKLLFHLHAELIRRAPKLAHQLSELTRNLSQALRTEEQEDQER